MKNRKNILIKALFIIAAFLTFNAVQAQTYKVFLNDSGTAADSADASSFLLQTQLADTLWEVKIYGTDNLPKSFISYKDPYLIMPHGDFAYFKKVYPSARSNTSDTLNYIENRGKFFNGQRDGVWVYYYSTEKPSLILTYDKGKLNGPYEELYRETNSTFLKGDYVNDRREGEWKYFDETGKLYKIEHYKRGKVKKTENF